MENEYLIEGIREIDVGLWGAGAWRIELQLERRR
jgi:hypothetical protein